jgi:hypothetical protein
MVVLDASKYGIPPSNPKITFGVGTDHATALVIPSFVQLSLDASPSQKSTHKGFAVRFDGVGSEIAASNHLSPICSGVANLFANV